MWRSKERLGYPVTLETYVESDAMGIVAAIPLFGEVTV
jgi:hypothetical protein